MTTAPLYDRAVLVDVLVYHYRVAPGKGCGCGWDELGRSWPEHVATVFEESVTARASGPAEPYLPPPTYPVGSTTPSDAPQLAEGSSNGADTAREVRRGRTLPVDQQHEGMVQPDGGPRGAAHGSVPAGHGRQDEVDVLDERGPLPQAVAERPLSSDGLLAAVDAVHRNYPLLSETVGFDARLDVVTLAVRAYLVTLSQADRRPHPASAAPTAPTGDSK